MSEPAADLLVPIPAAGRVFAVERRVRFGDVSPGGRARFDALAAYVQDIAGDDTADAALPDEMAWVARRGVFEVHHAPAFRELLTLQTFCSGTGGRWAERRVAMHGDQGGHVESTSLWVRIDAETGRPRPLTDLFMATYGEAAGGRRVSAKLQHDTTPGRRGDRSAWPLRFSDFDLLGHVNNAASWSVVEQVLVGGGLVAAAVPGRVGVPRPDRARCGGRWSRHVVDADELRAWVYDGRTGANYLTALVTPLAASI